MATTADLLAQAKAAYASLVMGTAAVEIRDSDGSSIRYTAANASRLRAYIKELENELAGSPTVQPPMRPVRG